MMMISMHARCLHMNQRLTAFVGVDSNLDFECTGSGFSSAFLCLIATLDVSVNIDVSSAVNRWTTD